LDCLNGTFVELAIVPSIGVLDEGLRTMRGP
jgi:hypothetical protein